METKQNYINRKYVDSEAQQFFENIDPCTGKALGKYPCTTHTEIDDVCSLAKEKFHEWKKASRVTRGEYLYNVSKIIEVRRNEIAHAISTETGKSFNESIAEVNEALHMAQYAFGSSKTPQGESIASEISSKDCYMLRKPKGLVAIISPWNFPFAIGAFWCAAPALVEGNTVVIKPSEDAPLSTQIASEIYHDAGIPPGVFNVVHGEGRQGAWLADNDDVDHICFTGSAEVGQKIRRLCADSWNKTCSCELGSKSAVIIFDDANFDLAMSASIASAFKLSGQRCVSAGRLIVQRGIYDKFCDSFQSYVRQIKVGAPFMDVGFVVGGGVIPSQNYMGPLINQQQLDRVQKYNKMVKEDPEAELLVTGATKTPGFYISPTVYKTEWRDAPYLKEEVFGPHVAIIPFDTIDDGINIYNDTDYGLAVGIVTEDFKKARICRDRCDYGMCYWNGGSIAAESHLAFGGVKKSGNGFPSAARTFRAVTHEVSWTVNHDEHLQFPQGMQ